MRLSVKSMMILEIASPSLNDRNAGRAAIDQQSPT